MCLSCFDIDESAGEVMISHLIATRPPIVMANILTDWISDGVKDWIAGLFDIKFKFLAYDISLTNISGTVKQLCDFTNLRTVLNSGQSLYNIISIVNQALVSVGLSLLTLFFMINMVQKAMEIERISWDKVIMEVVRFFVFKFLVENSLNLLETFLNITNNYMNTIANSLSISVTTITIGEAISNGIGDGFWGIAGGVIVALILVIAVIATSVGILVPVVSVMMKVVVCLSVAPVPIAMGIADYGRGTAKSFIMSVVALGIETWVIIIITKIYLLCLVNSAGVGSGLGGMVSQGIRIIFANSLYAALLSWGTQKVQSMVGGN